jgi:asparagine synthase (glutamine-hydrolysing)
VTPGAAESIRRTMKAAAETAQPLAPMRGPHVEMAAIRDGGRWLRQIEQLSARGGLSVQAPFFDDEVIRACLSVRPEDRVTPFRYRPVLQAALRGIVPAECLERSTKDVFSLPASRALAEHRDFLHGLWDNSRLAALGIVDEKRVRAAISSSMTHVEQNPLDVTIAVEVWLRTLDGAKGSEPC